MFALSGLTRDYAWGSVDAIPEFLGEAAGETPVAEVWFGAYSTGACRIDHPLGALDTLISHDPAGVLGPVSVERFGDTLPFLVKILSPAAPLSLQVHPSLAQAQDGYARAQAGGAGAPIDYVDDNHKPELLYPLTEFEALAGLRSKAQALDTLRGLHGEFVENLRGALSDGGVRAAVEETLTTATPEVVADVAAQCRQRNESGESPAPHSDDVLLRLYEAYPGDAGVVASLLLIPRILQPGEAMFIPEGVMHMYLSGLGVEVLANSDNVLRAGLTVKHVDIPELLNVIDPDGVARIYSPENTPLRRIATPISDFELHVLDPSERPVGLALAGPRIVLALEGGTTVRAEHSYDGSPTELTLKPGQAVFIAHSQGAITVSEGEALHTGLPS